MSAPSPSDRRGGGTPNVVRRRFRLHPAILWQVIERQSGKLSRAILEGVMNAIDAQATEVAITCASDRVTISDDGTGFGDLNEIERCFETFGQPHEEHEQKRYGAFRMGRGQMFAWGRNVWRSGLWRMEIDLKAQAEDRHRDEIDYGLTKEAEIAKGCRIEIDLYQPVLPSEVYALEDEIRSAVRFVDIPVTLNEKRVSVDPATQT